MWTTKSTRPTALVSGCSLRARSCTRTMVRSAFGRPIGTGPPSPSCCLGIQRCERSARAGQDRYNFERRHTAAVAMSSEPFTIGIIQDEASSDRAANLARADRLVREAARRGAQIICLKELFGAPYFC